MLEFYLNIVITYILLLIVEIDEFDWSFFVVSFQKEAVKLLVYLKQNCSAVAVKADFEAEGTGLEELVFLSNIAAMAGLNLTLKIGGCEAVFDLKQAKLFGARSVMVPVVESEFALKKFRLAVERVFGEKFSSINFILNVETKTCVENLNHILKFGSQFLSSLVVGRVDLSSSLNLSRSEIDSDLVFEECLKIVATAKKFGLPVGLGGGVSTKTYSVGFLNELDFDFFETRKVVFKNEHVEKNVFINCVKKATEFEILCLKFKREFFKQLAVEDDLRVRLLEQRLNELN